MKSLTMEALRFNHSNIARMSYSQLLTKLTLVLILSNWFFEVIGLRSFHGNIIIAMMVFVLWIMDAKYLQLEQAFRGHQRYIIDATPTAEDKSLFEFDVNAQMQRSLIKMMLNYTNWIYPLCVALVAINIHNY